MDIPSEPKLTAVIDKSLFHGICEALEPRSGQFWAEIMDRYQLVLPFVLIEEIWKDIACPGTRDKRLLVEMARAMYGMHPCWLDDPITLAFKELVLQEPVRTLINPPNEILDGLWSLDDEDPKLLKFLEERRAAKEQRTKEVIAEQDSMLPPDSFCYVKSKKEFFERFIRVKFDGIMEDPLRVKQLLEKIVGRDFRKRHSEQSREIDSAFERFNKTTFNNYPVTLQCIMAGMYYFYAPVFRIGNRDAPDARRFIGRSFGDQINNIEDEKYVISALLCDRLLTCDEGMANIMDAFKECGLWKGQVIYLHRAGLHSEIPKNLI